jgi:hypothetical protein
VIDEPIKDESVPGEGKTERVQVVQQPDATPLRVEKEGNK